MSEREPEFAVVLSGLLHRYRMEQSDLARRCGFDHSYISRLCTGSRLPSLHTLRVLDKHLTATRSEWNELVEAAIFGSQKRRPRGPQAKQEDQAA